MNIFDPRAEITVQNNKPGEGFMKINPENIRECGGVKSFSDGLNSDGNILLLLKMKTLKREAGDA